MSEFRKWTSIDKFSDVWNTMTKYLTPPVFYREKIKLHGTNAAIRWENGVATGQKRTSDVTVKHDNEGFAAWLESIDFASIVSESVKNTDFVVFGECAGKGIQKKDAITRIDRKAFFAFSVLLLDDETLIVEPTEIQKFVPIRDDIFVLPWFSDSVRSVHSNDVETARRYSEYLNSEVDKIGQLDLYVLENFGVEGSGEGLVAYPLTSAVAHSIPYEFFRTFTFKVKTESHGVQKVKNKAGHIVEVPGEVSAFVEMFATETRFQQIVNDHLDGVVSAQKTGDFLKALAFDIMKESKLELEKSGLEWKDVVKKVNMKAVAWYKKMNSVI